MRSRLLAFALAIGIGGCAGAAGRSSAGDHAPNPLDGDWLDGKSTIEPDHIGRALALGAGDAEVRALVAEATARLGNGSLGGLAKRFSPCPARTAEAGRTFLKASDAFVSRSVEDLAFGTRSPEMEERVASYQRSAARDVRVRVQPDFVVVERTLLPDICVEPRLSMAQAYEAIVHELVHALRSDPHTERDLAATAIDDQAFRIALVLDRGGEVEAYTISTRARLRLDGMRRVRSPLLELFDLRTGAPVVPPETMAEPILTPRPLGLGYAEGLLRDALREARTELSSMQTKRRTMLDTVLVGRREDIEKLSKNVEVHTHNIEAAKHNIGVAAQRGDKALTQRMRASLEDALHSIVREHYANFLAHTTANYAAPLPRYVTNAFERYVVCGDFSQGFVRCHCDGCGHDVLVGFSCKARGLCPSCNGRRMCNEAAAITDRILPNAPVRQWVVSLPFELRGLAATKPDVLTALGRIFAEEIARVTKRLANVAGSETGSISFPQRFGGSLNLHVHFHTLAVDGVFERLDDGVRLHETPPPERADVEDVARRVQDRALRWLRRHGYVDDRPAEERGNEPSEPTPIDGFARIALAGGTFLGRPFPPEGANDENLARKERRFSAKCDGFDVHCAVRIAKADDEGRERLVRYCARPPFALDRIEVMRDGRILYLMKTPRRGRTHRVMTPVELLARLAILIPPPYFPLIRYHGVFAARSSWRALVTLRPPRDVRPEKPKTCPEEQASAQPLASASPSASAPAKAATDAPPSPDLASEMRATSLAHPVPVAFVDPTTLSVEHWRRLLDGQLVATETRVDWAVLLRRTFGFDALRCPSCDKKMRVLASITDPVTVRNILTHLDVRADPLPMAPARDPTGQTNFGFDAA